VWVSGTFQLSVSLVGGSDSLYADFMDDFVPTAFVVFVVGEWRFSLASAEHQIQVNMRIRSEVLELLHAEDIHGASRGIFFFFANLCFESVENITSRGTRCYSNFHIIRKQPVSSMYQLLLFRQNRTAMPDTLLEDIHVFLDASRVYFAKCL
jgi:hypothetical protein